MQAMGVAGRQLYCYSHPPPCYSSHVLFTYVLGKQLNLTWVELKCLQLDV